MERELPLVVPHRTHRGGIGFMAYRDYSIPFHAMRRGLRHLQVEFRQDEIGDEASQGRWASRLARALAACGFAKMAEEEGFEPPSEFPH